MDIPSDLAGLAVALASGLLIGGERERRKGQGPRRSPAGIRTFALVALFGGLAAIVGGAIVIAVALAFVAGAALVGYLVTRDEDPGLTTEAALVVTFLLGALAIDQPELAAGLAVAVTVLLATRGTLHRFVSLLITEEELHDILIFAAAAVIVLPLLPNREVGPYDVINPFQIWRLVVLVMGISGVGYISTRVLGVRFGLPLAGLAGGFISSAATIGSMGTRTAGAARPIRRAAVAGAVLSTVATVLQMVIVLASVSAAVLQSLAGALAAGGAVAIVYGGLSARRIPPATEADAAGSGGRAFSLRNSLLFAALITSVLFISAAANDWIGSSGVYLSTALAGFADAHAASASAAALAARGEISTTASAIAVLIALTTNSATKIVVAMVAGGPQFGTRVGIGIVLVLLGFWAGAPLI